MTLSAFRDRAAQWFNRSNNRRILAAALTVGIFSVVVKLAAMSKELAVAYRFGTGDAIDAFLIAFLLPSLAINIVSGSFSAAFTPLYVEVRENCGAAAAFELLRSASAGTALVVLPVTLLVFAGVPVLPLLATGFSAEKLALTEALFLILLPTIALNGFIAVWSAALNCEGHFAWAALAPIGVPILTLVMVLLTGGILGGYALALGTVMGYALQCGILAGALATARMPVLPRWGGATPELTRALRQYVPMVVGAALTSSSWAIGQAMAATLPSGSVAALNYGNKIPALLSEIGSMAIATALLPHFSLMVARKEWAAIRHTLRVYGRLIAVVTIPFTLVAIYLSPTIVRLLFERGAFGREDTQRVAEVLSFYLLQVPFVMLGMLFVRLASSLQRNQLLLLGAAILLPLNVVLNGLFMRWLGAAGIALATSVVYFVSCAYLFAAVERALRAIERSHVSTAKQ